MIPFRCLLLGHTSYHLDENHPAHCHRCSKPDRRWLEQQRRLAEIRDAADAVVDKAGTPPEDWPSCRCGITLIPTGALAVEIRPGGIHRLDRCEAVS